MKQKVNYNNQDYTIHSVETYPFHGVYSLLEKFKLATAAPICGPAFREDTQDDPLYLTYHGGTVTKIAEKLQSLDVVLSSAARKAVDAKIKELPTREDLRVFKGNALGADFFIICYDDPATGQAREAFFCTGTSKGKDDIMSYCGVPYVPSQSSKPASAGLELNRLMR